MDGLNLFRVEVDSFGCYNKTKEFSASYPQERFSRIHLELMSSHDFEYLFEIGEMILFITAFDRNVINVTFDCLMKMFSKNGAHSALVCGPGVL